MFSIAMLAVLSTPCRWAVATGGVSLRGLTSASTTDTSVHTLMKSTELPSVWPSSCDVQSSVVFDHPVDMEGGTTWTSSGQETNGMKSIFYTLHGGGVDNADAIASLVPVLDHDYGWGFAFTYDVQGKLSHPDRSCEQMIESDETDIMLDLLNSWMVQFRSSIAIKRLDAGRFDEKGQCTIKFFSLQKASPARVMFSRIESSSSAIEFRCKGPSCDTWSGSLYTAFYHKFAKNNTIKMCFDGLKKDSMELRDTTSQLLANRAQSELGASKWPSCDVNSYVLFNNNVDMEGGRKFQFTEASNHMIELSYTLRGGGVGTSAAMISIDTNQFFFGIALTYNVQGKVSDKGVACAQIEKLGTKRVMLSLFKSWQLRLDSTIDIDTADAGSFDEGGQCMIKLRTHSAAQITFAYISHSRAGRFVDLECGDGASGANNICQALASSVQTALYYKIADNGIRMCFDGMQQ